jgi:methylamine dehydrogenase heavy chain
MLFQTALPSSAAEFVPQTIEKSAIPPAMRRVYVFDDVLPHMVDGRVYVLDGADLKLKGMLESGFAGMVAAAPEKHQVYVAATFYERLTRGKRTDVVQVFDDENLKLIDEIPVSSNRAMAVAYRNLFQRSSDGNLLLIQNATPATSVTVLDVATKKQFEVPAPGCYGIYPSLSQPKRFSTLCGNGTIGTYTISDKLDGASRKASAKVFDANADPLYTHAEKDSSAYIFLSFQGKIVRISLEGETAGTPETFDLIGGADGKWAPGGYQPMTFDAKSGIVYVLMHSGAIEGSHKNPSNEIWAYDLRSQRLLSRSAVANLTSLTLSPSEPNVLVAINGVDSKVERFTVDAKSYKITPAGDIKLGETAVLVEAP